MRLVVHALAIGWFIAIWRNRCVATTAHRQECLCHVALQTALDWLALRPERGLQGAEEYGRDIFSPRLSVHAAAESRRGGVDCRAAGALEHLSTGAVYRRARRRPEIKIDAVHDAAADSGRDVAAGGRAISVRGFVAGRRVSDGPARRARGRADRRSDYHDSCAGGP